jgi:hypothetical protein
MAKADKILRKINDKIQIYDGGENSWDVISSVDEILSKWDGYESWEPQNAMDEDDEEEARLESTCEDCGDDLDEDGDCPECDGEDEDSDSYQKDDFKDEDPDGGDTCEACDSTLDDKGNCPECDEDDYEGANLEEHRAFLRRTGRLI